MVKNQDGILLKVLQILQNMSIGLESVNTKRIKSSQTQIKFEVLIPHYDYLIIDRFVDRLKIQLHNNLLDYSLKILEE